MSSRANQTKVRDSLPQGLLLLVASALSACSPNKNTSEAATSTGAATSEGNATGISDSASVTSNGATSNGVTSSVTLPTDGSVSAGSETGEMSSSPGCEFICDDMARPECVVWDDDCPEGQKCTPYLTDPDAVVKFPDSTKCAPLPREPAALGELCLMEGDELLDNCDRGLLCVLPSVGEKFCMKACSASQGRLFCAEPGYECAVYSVYAVCLPECHPLIPPPYKPCDSEHVCVPSDGVFACVPDKSGAGGQLYQGCNNIGSCKSGLACVNSSLSTNCNKNSPSCCLSFCDLSNPSCDDPAEVCQAYFSKPAPPGFANLGLCQKTM